MTYILTPSDFLLPEDQIHVRISTSEIRCKNILVNIFQ